MFEKISGKKIKEAIKLAGFTQVEFAKKMNCKQSYISQMINGTTNVSEETLTKISILTKQPLSFFIEGEPVAQITHNYGIIDNNNNNNVINQLSQDIELLKAKVKSLELEIELLKNTR